MFCKNCGTQLKDGAAFCSNCGMKIMPVGAGIAQGSARKKKPLQIPIIIMAVLIVVVIGCLAAALVMRERDVDENMAEERIISRERDFDEDMTDEQDKGQELSDGAEAVQEDSPQGMQEADEPEEEVGQYILPNSSAAYLSYGDLMGMTQEECRLARNELYARHGRKFDDEGLQSYFDAKDWYIGYIDPADFSDSLLNDYELANRDLIVQYEEEMGYR